jgi:hypothetical protein
MELKENVASRLRIAREFVGFFAQTRWWWLLPVIIVLLPLGLLLVFAQGSAIAPLIYTLF